MKKIKHAVNTAMIIGVKAIEAFELDIFIGSRINGDPELFISWEFNSWQVQAVIDDLKEMLDMEENEGLKDAYREAVIALQSDQVKDMIKAFSFPHNLN